MDTRNLIILYEIRHLDRIWSNYFMQRKFKVLEEIDELIEAVKEDTNKIHEAADVLYHLMVLLEANDIKIEDVMDELKKRQKK